MPLLNTCDWNSFVVCKLFKLVADSGTEEVCVEWRESFLFYTRSKMPTLVLRTEVPLSRKKSGNRGFSDLPLSAGYEKCFVLSIVTVLSLLLIQFPLPS